MEDYTGVLESGARRLGISGVPFYVLDERYALQGAQPVEVFLRALDTITDVYLAHDSAAGLPLQPPRTLNSRPKQIRTGQNGLLI